ncbi:MAG: hypothetical protein FJW83_09340 [Actinobacteria bacterium]|nr:hypothetical protein [Actinomycetota bacterium]
MQTRSLVAFNTALDSENKIHDDDVARRFGFSGGLVPGVDVYAYLTWGPVSTWGRSWLERGRISVRFAVPTYDGDTMTVEWDEPEGRLRNPTGAVVASATAGMGPAAATVDLARYLDAPLPGPGDRPPASPSSLAVGTVLGTWSVAVDGASQSAYRDDVREELLIYGTEDLLHPGFVLRAANRLIAENVVLGPWIHVGSEVTNLAAVPTTGTLDARGTVTAEYERKGHRFVEVDLLVRLDEVPVARIEHTAIYLPRQVAEG